MPPLPPAGLVRDTLLFLVLPAFLVTAVVLAFIRKAAGSRRAECGTALALAAGLLVGNLLHPSLPYVPSERGWKWLFWAVMAALIMKVAGRLLARPVVGWLSTCARRASLPPGA